MLGRPCSDGHADTSGSLSRRDAVNTSGRVLVHSLKIASRSFMLSGWSRRFLRWSIPPSSPSSGLSRVSVQHQITPGSKCSFSGWRCCPWYTIHLIYADLSARQALLFAAFPNSLISSRHYPIFYPQGSKHEAQAPAPMVNPGKAQESTKFQKSFDRCSTFNSCLHVYKPGERGTDLQHTPAGEVR